MPNYTATDGNGDSNHVADDLEEACDLVREDWASCGGWPEGEGRFYVSVNVSNDEDEDDSRQIEVLCGSDPEPPDCVNDEDHDWRSPHSIVGGIDSNPGVWGCGGTQVQTLEICCKCGVKQHYTSESTPGNYPKEPPKTTYEEADDRTRAYAASETNFGQDRYLFEESSDGWLIEDTETACEANDETKSGNLEAHFLDKDQAVEELWDLVNDKAYGIQWQGNSEGVEEEEEEEVAV